MSRKEFQAWSEAQPRIALALPADLGRMLSRSARSMLFEIQHMG
ncbi:hypothetical protein [Ahniella affigens]|nr:hypothetical protein [Ahniella affigens]